MAEFKLQHIVAELLESLGGKVEPEKLVEYLQKSLNYNNPSCSTTGSQVAAHNFIQQLVGDSSNSEAFTGRFNDLKQKNVDSLNSYVQLLSQISQDTGVKQLLHDTRGEVGTAHPSTKITKDDLPTVKSKLKEKIKIEPKNDLSDIINNASTLPLATTPSMMSWVQRKPNMTCDFSVTSMTNYSAVIPELSQENMLIEDLLNVLIGLPGCYIEAEELKDPYGPRSFKINANITMPLRELVNQILPLASHYSTIQRFVEEKMRFEFGQVNNALAEAMQGINKKHMLFTVKLEHEARNDNLNLQKMWFYVQRNMQCMSMVADIAASISKSSAKGGKVLSILHDYINESIGDEKTHQLCLDLMEAASVPYMKMLGMWIYMGIISDPINEFLVEDNEVFQKEEMPVDYSADYWVKKYFIRRDIIPKFLEPVSDMILKTGKYLNVIRQCGKSVENKVLPLRYEIEERHYMEAIEKAYVFASQTLLDLVLKENDLIGRLRSVKHYFLLDQGDFIVTLFSLCEKELAKDVSDVIQCRLESLLDLALRLSSAVNDPYKDDLKTELLSYDLQFQMFKILSIQTNQENDYWSGKAPRTLSVIESFSFGYEVRWPLSLILNKKSLTCYQMIFRHLFYCKYVERMICQVWRANKVAKRFPFQDARHYRQAFALRQRMLHSVQNLEYHMMVEVIEPHWNAFLSKILKVNNVDEILSCHCDFLDSCLKDCMLTIPEILATVVRLLAICVDFCKFMQQSLGNNELEGREAPPVGASFKDSVAAADESFAQALRDLLAQINELNRDTSEHERLFNLLYRLDFNSYYSHSGKSLMSEHSG